MFSYTLGLDIGIASVGWCVLGEDHIIALGVRAFDKAETAKEGESLNLARRNARLMRRRLRRRAWRLTKLARVLKRHGVIDDVRLFQPQNPSSSPVWALRVAALDRLLQPEEWARVIYHLCKHRGFHWISRAEEKQAENESKSEGGQVKQALTNTRRRMEEKNYRTAAEMVLAEFPHAQRNKHGEYTKALPRIMLGEELRQLFEHQRNFGNPHASKALEAAVLGNGDQRSGLFWAQKPALAGEALLGMVGRCTFEKDEYRAPKASFTAERHVWLTRLNNLRIVVDGEIRPLNTEERKLALPLPYQQASDLSYRQLASALVKAGLQAKDGFKFAGLAYPSELQKSAGKAKDPESATLVKLPAWQKLRNTFKQAGLETEWEGLAGAACAGQPELLDQIAFILSVFKDDDEARRALQEVSLPDHEAVIEALLDIRFDKFHALSLKALRRIVPEMEQGLRYDEACTAAGYHHSQLHVAGDGQQHILPPFYKGRDGDGTMLFANDDIPRNPVVLRALNQARKVVNAVIRRYGSPMAVNIEMARDLSRPLDERNRIKKEQEEYRSRNERDKDEFRCQFVHAGEPNGRSLEKWRLYREQQGKCAYSLRPIDIERLLEAGYVEVDHALPYSRSFDDSKNNRVLTLTSVNRDKGNRTPYEYLDGATNSPRWQAFATWVEGNKAYRLAKRSRLLRKKFGADEAKEFRDRNLNDTRYICRFFKNYVEQHLQLATESEAKRCVVLSGQMTAFLRARWGLLKSRSANDRHHALDAAVVAACTHGMVKRLADYTRKKELEQVRAGFVDAETGKPVDPARFDLLNRHFPEPWPHFHHELQARLNIDDPAQLRDEMRQLGTYSESELAELRPLFVSRSVQRRNVGAAHKDTIYAQPEALKPSGQVIQQLPLAKLAPLHFGFLATYFSHKKSLCLQDGNVTRKQAARLYDEIADRESPFWKESSEKWVECRLADPLRNKEFYEALFDQLQQHKGDAKKAFANGFTKPVRRINSAKAPIVRTISMMETLSGIPVRGGVAKNDSMLRVDVFTKDGKFHLVPVYVHHKVTGLPDRAIVAYKDEDEWTLVDHSFDWCFSLHPNDLIRITLKTETFFGYYSTTDRSTGAISLWAHDRNQSVGKDGLYRGVGAKTARKIEKFHVDALGNIYPAPPEHRHGLA